LRGINNLFTFRLHSKDNDHKRVLPLQTLRGINNLFTFMRRWDNDHKRVLPLQALRRINNILTFMRRLLTCQPLLS